MNKAFVKEAEPSHDYCPRCGSDGDPVEPRTVAAHVDESVAKTLGGALSYCPSERCEVVYFDSFGRSIFVEMLRAPAYPKAPDAPICPCFGLTCEEIQRDVEEGVATRTKGIVARAKSAEARCDIFAVDGRSCVPRVQKYYMKYKGLLEQDRQG
jgi:Zinc binding domain